ncbi:MAG: amidohydrolase [Deltaproteobacteria bacterium]|jgi:amidohydrolase|nr:amidohydrolase [Deltaproteobacteria bacterium]
MKDKTFKIAELIREYRRDFHMYPEIGFNEKRTSEKVATVLENLGYRVRRGVARTGIVAELGDGKPVIAIRADMDALPIQEANDVPYASKIPGMMHACGHDAHTAIALGMATLLKNEQFPGTIRFLFQPSEDSDDEEGVSGAPRMIEDGAMENVDAILAVHVDAGTESGMIRTCPDKVLAGADLFKAEIIGSGGHGGIPHKTIDPIHIVAHVILAINAIVSRRVPAFKTAVVSLGTLRGGTADTIIPDKVEIKGTIRYTEMDVREKVHEELRNAFSIAKSLGGDYTLEINAGSPPTMNNPKVVKTLLDVTEDLFGENKIVEYEQMMAGDDFAHLARLAPAGYFLLGCRIEGDERQHHDCRFDIDENCLSIGTAILIETALRLLRTPQDQR